MDQSRNKGGGILGSYSPYSSADPSMNVPVSSTPVGGLMSPYLNFDPAYITPGGEPEFIIPEGQNRQRGRLEHAFYQIGGSVMAGAAGGGLNGLYSETRAIRGENLPFNFKVRKTRILNIVAKQGASSAQIFGVIALMYSIFGVMLTTFVRADDELNTLTAATATGLLFKCSAGWKPCLRAGGVGFSVAAAYCLFSNRDKITKLMGKR